MACAPPVLPGLFPVIGKDRGGAGQCKHAAGNEGRDEYGQRLAVFPAQTEITAAGAAAISVQPDPAAKGSRADQDAQDEQCISQQTQRSLPPK